MKSLSLLIRREFASFWQNKVFVFAFLVMPLLLATVFGFVYVDGKVRRLPILVVDEDHSPTSAKYMDMLSENNILNVTTVRNQTMDLTSLTLEKRVVAVVIIPYRFEADIIFKRRPEVNCYLNMSNTLTAGVAGNAVQLSTATLNAGIQINTLEKKGIPYKIASKQYKAFHHNLFEQYNPGSNYLYFLWPGLIFAILHQLLLLATAVGFSQEFANKTFNGEGLLRYTHSAIELIFVKVFPYLILSGFTVAAYFAFSFFFNMPPPLHPRVLFLSAFLMAVGTCMLGTLYSILNPIPVVASQSLMTLSTPAFTLAGFVWPSEQIPEVLQALADMIPLTPFLKVVRLSWMQGASLQEVMPNINHQLILLTAYFLLSFLLLRKKIAQTINPPKPVPVKV